MLAKIYSSAIVGVDARLVEVEVSKSKGIPGLDLVGLPDASLREGTVRIRSALAQSGFALSPSRFAVNLAPADLRKDGAAFDLAIALGLMAAQHTISYEAIEDVLAIGELALDGRIRPVRGALASAELAFQLPYIRRIVVPEENYEEAAVLIEEQVTGETHRDQVSIRNMDTSRIDIVSVISLQHATHLLCAPPSSTSDSSPSATLRTTVFSGRTKNDSLTPLLESTSAVTHPTRNKEKQKNKSRKRPDFADVQGQHRARRAAEIAAAGNHNMLMIGPPGAGKTMIAEAMPSIMPTVTSTELIEILKIRSASGDTSWTSASALIQKKTRPFRAPHHSASTVGLVGGGSIPKPGEISFAHNGVLFLDELPEFDRKTLEMLRQPLESGDIAILRARDRVIFPAKFMLIAAMNPCPCGYDGSDAKTCVCADTKKISYRSKISGPLLDRIDIFVRLDPPNPTTLFSERQSEASKDISARVVAAQQRRRAHCSRVGIDPNLPLDAHDIRTHIALDAATRQLLTQVAEKFSLSSRGAHRIVYVAQTIAYLDDRETITRSDIAYAVSLRRDRFSFAR